MIKTIMTAIDLSALAYERPEEIFHWYSELQDKFYNFKWIDNKETDTQVFTCEDDEKVWVVFRGTEMSSFKDWITNLNCAFKKDVWGDVHRGFLSNVNSVRWNILDHIYDSMKSKQIVYTGHSQGAANAELLFSQFAYYLHQQNQICIPIETPRNMSKDAAKAFGDEYGSKIYHVINNNDIVTRVPTRLMGYAHVDNINLNYLDENGLLHHEMTWWEMFQDRVKGRLYDFGKLGTDGIKDHPIDEVQRIWRKLL